MTSYLPWVGFIAFVILMLAIDLGLLHRDAQVIRLREAVRFTIVCAVLAVGFCGVVYLLYENRWLGIGVTVGEPLTGTDAALKFLTGWVLEQSLSIDNVFVIALVFKRLRVPPAFQHRVLFWGILGALVFRGVMIGLGTAAIHRFPWFNYVFGAILLFAAIKLLLDKDEEVEPDKNLLVRLARRVFPVVPEFHEQRFFVRIDGKLAMTPLFVALLVIESLDVMFAVDSIPAVIAITSDSFLVFTSNVFAILSLRSLFFAIVALLDRMRYVTTSLVLVLGFVGAKILLSHHVHIPTLWSLGVIVGILGVGAVASLLRPLPPRE